jgi:hypothetical protein
MSEFPKHQQKLTVLATTAGLKTEFGLCHGRNPETHGISGSKSGRPVSKSASIKGIYAINPIPIPWTKTFGTVFEGCREGKP